MHDRPSPDPEDEPGQPPERDAQDTGPKHAQDTGPKHAAGRISGTNRRTMAIMAGRALIGLLSAAALIATAVGWVTLGRVQKQVPKTNVLAQLPHRPPDDGATDILLVGSDSRTDAQGNPLPDNVLKQLRTEATSGLNTDTIIVIRVPNRGGKAYGFSIPRDAYVPIPGYRDDKINTAYGSVKKITEDRLRAQGGNPADIEHQAAQAGRGSLIGAVQDLTGLRIDHYAEINLYGFYLLTEAVGGVDICLNQATSDPDSGANFAAGHQVVTGGDALAFVRQRKNLPRGDLDRIVRQQVFMAALVKKALSSGMLTDQAALSRLLDSVNKAVVLDESWDLLGFIQQMQGLSAGKVEFATIPVTGVGARDDRGQSIITVDRDQVRGFVTSLVSPANAPPGTGSQPSTTAPNTPPGQHPPSVAPNPGQGHGIGGGPTLHLDGGGALRDQPPVNGPDQNPIDASGTRCVN